MGEDEGGPGKRVSPGQGLGGQGAHQVHSVWSEHRGCGEDEGDLDSMKAVELTSYSLFRSWDPAWPSSCIGA